MFAFSSSDHNVYLMNFSVYDKEITLVATLSAHAEEVTQVMEVVRIVSIFTCIKFIAKLIVILIN